MINWSQGPVHADPIIVVLMHWKEANNKYSMSELSSRLVRAYLGKTYMYPKVSHCAHYVDVILEQNCTTWGTDSLPYQQADGLSELQACIKELVHQVSANHREKFHILTVVDVHCNEGNGRLLYNKGSKYCRYGTPLDICSAVFGETNLKSICNDAVLMLLTCSGMVLQALPTVHACKAGFCMVIAFTANTFNSQCVAEIWLGPFLWAFYQDHAPGKQAILSGYSKELSHPLFSLGIFVFGGEDGQGW
ncbi:hypothetical protein DACRYDRAFT_110441 [Dacryopinax primogenitus]|uniref:Uncharacterized protein n=1 Tax=Dacryopinax primogenitus (strain DJM 731) TaxID=1858805 RepID=M5G5T7_DACPD|nr:uncharacterized protein DACRYDRAFT_110441 [Dacryopinax primogenitus]EJT99122.1 hypothetical protein DACRYDRAFT_110441 [Dacryopinax primogenitus]